MKKILTICLILFASINVASGQGCGPTNPGCVVPTAPPGTNNNQAASTAFVHAATVPGSITVGSTTIVGGTPNGLFYDAAGFFGNLATANNGVLVTSNTGIPGISTVLPNGITATTQSPGDNTTKVATDAFANKVVGVFNPRTQYGAIPDGSTDNATAIAAAFTASNAFSNGIPTVYFDCDTTQTTCVYNYGGSGISPINPLVATTILCAPGVTLNYTGSAHAADIGPTNLTVTETKPYKIQGCRWTGGASYTQGIVINNFLIETEISGNTFNNFGNQTGYNIKYNSNNWEATIKGNFWYDSDGFTRNMVDGHTIVNGATQITNNAVECIGPANAACSTVTYGVGFWVHSAWITSNSIQFHYPNLRIANSPSSSTGVHVINNHFEGNSGGPTPCITYGDPGGTAAAIGNGSTFISNFFYCPSSANSPIVGPETPASASYDLDGTYWDHNLFGVQFGWAAAEYINANGGAQNLIGYNTDSSNLYLGPNSSIPVIDRTIAQKFSTYTYPRNFAQQLQGKPPAWDSTGSFLELGSFLTQETPLLCANTTASGTAQVCVTSPRYDGAGSDLALVAGSTIIYTTNTANTGSLTISVNATANIPVKKNGGTANLGAGDIKVNIPYLLSFDGTNLNIANTFAVQGLTALTYATLPTPAAGMEAYISDGKASNCGDTSCTTWGTAVSGGGGALPLRIWYNGAAWTLTGK